MKENTINEKDSLPTFLNKKRKNQLNEKEEIIINNIKNDIKKLINENKIDENFLKDILFQQNKQIEKKEKNNRIVIKLEKNINMNNNNFNSIIKGINSAKLIEESNSINEWYHKINLFPSNINNNTLSLNEELNWDEVNNIKINNEISEEENGIITFHQKRDNKPYHYIYLKDSFSFDMSLKNKIYSWKIKFLSTSNLIGVGLSYKDIVLKNNSKFFDENNNNFINGTFSLIQTYNPIIKNYCIRPWNCFDKNLVNHVAEFPSFKKGKEILIKYNTNKDRIEFIIKKHVYFMEDIKLNRINNINLILTPCALFYNDCDKIIFSEFKCEEVNDKDNEED